MKTPAIPMHRLAASVALLVVVLALSMALPAISSPLDRELGSPLGPIPTADLLAMAVAAFAAGIIGRDGFRYWAVALAAVVWLLRLAALIIVAPAMTETSSGDLLKSHLPGLPLGMLVAWFAAFAGERFAEQRRREKAQRPARARWR